MGHVSGESSARGAALPIFSARSSILLLLVRSFFSFISSIRSPVIAAAASIGRRLPLSVRAFKSSQGLLFSEAKKAICRGSGPGWRAGAGAWVWSPLPPSLSKEFGERCGKRSPPRGAGPPELLTCTPRGAARVPGGGNPISIDQRPKPRKEG